MVLAGEQAERSKELQAKLEENPHHTLGSWRSDPSATKQGARLVVGGGHEKLGLIQGEEYSWFPS